MSRNSSDKRIASISHPIIHALINRLFKFTTQEDALNYVEKLKSKFIFSRKIKTSNNENTHSSILWIRNYSLTNEELNQGYTGNFAEITCDRSDNVYTLMANKLDTPLVLHPQKNEKKRQIQIGEILFYVA